MIDFEHELEALELGGYNGMQFSVDTVNAIRNYLFKGWMPGGHIEAQFAHDLERALYSADVHNRKVFWAIAKWIREAAPAECQGSYDAVEAWCENPAIRQPFIDAQEKITAWKLLAKKDDIGVDESW